MADKAKKQVSIVDKTAIVNINSPKALAAFAKELKAFIVANKLYTTIKDKNYVHVEGWQFAGASMGIFPQVVADENISPQDNPKVYKYRSRVELVQLSSGRVIGSGVALCSNEEAKKKTFDEYAVLSMAQTRATGKAFRMTLGWIMKLAGYEATPAEEMSATIIEAEDDEPQQAQIPLEDVRLIVDNYLTKLSPAEKLKFVKEVTGVIADKSLDEPKYRRLYEKITALRGQHD